MDLIDWIRSGQSILEKLADRPFDRRFEQPLVDRPLDLWESADRLHRSSFFLLKKNQIVESICCWESPSSLSLWFLTFLHSKACLGVIVGSIRCTAPTWAPRWLLRLSCQQGYRPDKSKASLRKALWSCGDEVNLSRHICTAAVGQKH